MDTVEILNRFGVGLERCASTMATIGPFLPRIDASLPDLLAQTADPAMALANLEALSEDEAMRGGLSELDRAEFMRLLALLGSSQSLFNTLKAAATGWVRLFRSCSVASRRGAEAHVREFATFVTADTETFLSELRRLRNHEYLRIGLADLDGRYDVETTVDELTELADGVATAAVHWARHHVGQLYGDLWLKPPHGATHGVTNSFVVLGMGKLGGRELNFSSDVDLIYLYASDEGVSTGGARGTAEPRSYFTRMAELVTKALHEITADGFVFRVDLRLRPEGVNGPLTNSVANALLYYESYGQTWERTALIQARPIAGNIALGEQFLHDVQPFVFRRYLDFSTVADMKAMKKRVEGELGSEARRYNVKLGRGGIREIEFVAQVLQLIHGGRDERLRGGGSLCTLRKLGQCGYLPPDEGEILRRAYRFLRNVEHKIQIVNQRQTHAIPEGSCDQEALARRLGFRGEDSLAQLWVELDQQRSHVRGAFEKLFYEPTAESQRIVDPLTRKLLECLDQREQAIAMLAQMGFVRPQECYDDVLLLRDGPRWAPARAKRRRTLFDLFPSLLAAVLKSPDPDLALRTMATYVSTIGARTSFLSLLQENPATLRMLVDLFGGSQYLSNWFVRHPELLDSLVRADLVKLYRSADECAEELDEGLARASDVEEQLDVLRRMRNLEFLRIGISDIQSALGPLEVNGQLTNVAEACLRSAFNLAVRDVARRQNEQRLPGQSVVLGMGKLGSRELNYNSDLDLIFVYEEGHPAGSSSISAQESFSRVAQQLMMLLQATTREGVAYRIDTRLRPSGNKGPLVTSFASFSEYHETSAQLWERQALIKARPVAGDAELGGRVAQIVARFVYRAPLTGAEVGEIRRMRLRMENEIARETEDRINIKTGRGGLVDIEFLTQMLQMHYGSQCTRLRHSATLNALQALAEEGILPKSDWKVLDDGYRFIRRVENALRLAYDRPVEELERADSDSRAVARRLGLGSCDDSFWVAWKERREVIRACYDDWFTRGEVGLPQTD